MLDSTLGTLSRGYAWLPDRRRHSGGEAFHTRLMGRPALVIHGLPKERQGVRSLARRPRWRHRPAVIGPAVALAVALALALAFAFAQPGAPASAQGGG
jgi:hypothetical protein